jgi:hypothetical protein
MKAFVSFMLLWYFLVTASTAQNFQYFSELPLFLRSEVKSGTMDVLILNSNINFKPGKSDGTRLNVSFIYTNEGELNYIVRSDDKVW